MLPMGDLIVASGVGVNEVLKEGLLLDTLLEFLAGKVAFEIKLICVVSLFRNRNARTPKPAPINKSVNITPQRIIPNFDLHLKPSDFLPRLSESPAGTPIITLSGRTVVTTTAFASGTIVDSASGILLWFS